MTVKEILFAVFGALAIAFAFIMNRYGKKFKEMADKTPSNVDNVVLYIANLTVPFIEKAFQGETGAVKKENAIKVVSGELAKIGLNASGEVVSDAIEKAVSTMKGEEVKEKGVDEKK